MIRALAVALLLTACATTPDPYAVERPLPPLMAIAVPIDGSGMPETVTTYPPTPITAMCGDGWVSYSDYRSSTCAGHGGVRQWVNQPPQ
jgi:hypothetical protein